MKYIKITDIEKEEILKEIKNKLENQVNINNFFYNYEFKKPKEIDRPQLYFSTSAYFKMLMYIQTTDHELAWHGTVVRKNNSFLIKNIFLYPQIVNISTVETNQEDYNKFIQNLSKEELKQLRFQGHSHVNMSVYPSGTDDEYYKNIINMLPDDDFYIFLIGNKKNEFFINLYDLKTNILYEVSDIDYHIITEDGKNYKKCLDEEKQQNFKKKYEEYKKAIKTFTVHEDDDDYYKKNINNSAFLGNGFYYDDVKNDIIYYHDINPKNLYNYNNRKYRQLTAYGKGYPIDTKKICIEVI